MKILPSITTTGFSPSCSNWREKIIKAKELGLKEFCFFPTCLDKKGRKEAYSLLEKTGIKNIPFVHLRTDMDFKEIEYFINNFNTKAFNIHSESEYPFVYDYSKSKYKDIIFIENIYNPLNGKEIEKFGGICLDFTHLENDRLSDKKKFDCNVKIIEKYPIGCNHASAIKKSTRIDADTGQARYDRHFLENLSELDYLKKYPISYFSDFVALELENGPEEQLKMIDYINNLLKR
jgi:hypothetical protein